jgi:hypothetical protein
MRLIVGLCVAVALSMVLAGSTAAKPVSGPGDVAVGVDASVWDSDLPAGDGLLPIGGSGQINGEFTTAERLGIQIGLRAQERFVGPIEATPSTNGKVGIYEAAAGGDSDGRATWNYDWHVDLRNAHGVAAGTTLDDYDLTLETDMFTEQFGFDEPIDLTFGGVIGSGLVLYQQSFNPVFGNTEFDPSAPGVYNLRLVLTPKTFNGPPLAVAIQVVVTD